MRDISLGETGLRTSAIGYGCAGLMRPATEPERQALLAAAFDVGIRHFDVARYYGHGQAEAVLGRFITRARCRDQISITTKFGMEPLALGGASRGRFLMSLARRVASIHPSVRKILSARASAGVKKNRFDVLSAQASLETSLRELGTDHIDLFLLHEANLEDTRAEGLLGFLEDAKQAGKIRAFGLGSDFPLVPEIIKNNPAFTRVVQIANGVGQWNRRLLPSNSDQFVNTHGGLKILPVLEVALRAAPPDVVSDWKTFGDIEGPALAGLLLGLALHDNPEGVVLFSSTQPSRIRSNITEAMRHATLSAAEWKALELAAETALAAGPVR